MALRLSSSSAFARYGVAIGAVALATLLRWPLVWTCGELPVFILFFLAIALVAMVAGGGPVALATGLSVLAALLLIPPSGQLQLSTSADLVATSVFLVSGSIVAFMAAWLARSRRDLAAAAEHRGAERERELATEFLRLINESTGARQLVQAALHFFQAHSGCAAVGIRLREGDDYPYYETHGFPEQFVRLESSLCVRNPQGDVQRDHAGNPVLSCMCGSVICGRFDPSKPFYTPAGSFWTNDTTRLLVTTTDAACQTHIRDRCIGAGYKSVALIALRVGEQRLGLLQLNDRHRNRFTPEILALWERLAGYLAVALAKAQADEAVRESEAKFAKAFAASPDAMVLSRAEDGLIREINESCVRIFGHARDEVIGKRSTDLDIMDPADRERSMAVLKRDGRLRDYEMPIRNGSGEVRSALCSVEPIEIAGESLILSILRDITEQKQAALDQDMATELLRMLNRGAGGLHGLIGEVLRLIRERAGFDAVGLRLRQGDDCPYFQQDGFSDEFLREENFLCAKGTDGSILRDPSGKPVLECTCGLVLSGRADPTMSCFTNGGSFWTNRSTELLALAPEDDPREKPRNRCIHAGYQSVALIPVRSGEQIVGLLQLNDRRPDRFTPERIRFFEGMASNLGMALHRWQTEEALRTSEQRLVMAKEAANVGIFDCDIASETMQWDSRLREFWGLAPDERVTLELFMAGVHPDDRALVQAAADKAMDPAGNGRFVAEHRIVRRDGRECWHAAMGQVSFEHGKPIRMVGTVQDVTPRKHAEQALRESEQRLNRAQAIAHLGSWELDLTRNRLTWSDEVYRIFGLAPQEFGATYEAFLEHVHPDDRAAVDAAYSGSLHENRDSYEIEHRVMRKSGEVRFVHEKCQHMRDDAGRLVASLGMVLDITERKRAEEALRQSEERLNQAVRVADLGIFEHDHRSDVIYYAPVLRDIWGWGEDEPVTLPAIIDRVLPEDRQDVAARIRRAHDPAGDGLYAVEHRIVRPDGGIRWLLVRSRTFFEGEGAARRTLRTVGAMLDITERKRAEEALLAAKAAAESATQAKDHFLAALSHELRTPLTPVLAVASALKDDPRLTADVREDLELIQRNVTLEARLIDDLLDVTRIVRGKVELNRQMTDLCTVIQRAVEVCQPDIEARRLQFGVDLESCVPCTVYADPARLQQVFWNLLKNAIKFTPHGGHVGIRCWRDSGGQVVIEVKDSGIGIDPEVMPRLFSAFEQGERSTTRQFGGLGLGLTITKGLVEMHGGSIEAHSEGKGKGATFVVKLPSVVQSAVGGPAPMAGSPMSTIGSPRSLRILLVEDHGDTVRVMKRLLAGHGHAVQTAGDVAAALELAEAEEFDLLLSDLGLPDGSGVDLIRELRSRGSTLPGIALSGYGQEEDIHRSREAGFAAHLTKPTNPDQLIETISRITRPNPTR